jgi:tetratricopeptide (TPR) repeat protein
LKNKNNKKVIEEIVWKANEAYIGQNDDQAAKYYLEALELGADLEGTEHVQLGDALDTIGQHTEAIKHYRIAIKKDPNQVHCYNYLAVDLLNQNDKKGAEEAFRKVIEL